jgi:hypothetical protein
LDLQGHLGVV